MATKKKSAVKKRAVKQKEPVWTAEQVEAVREAITLMEGIISDMWDKVVRSEDADYDNAQPKEDW